MTKTEILANLVEMAMVNNGYHLRKVVDCDGEKRFYTHLNPLKTASCYMRNNGDLVVDIYNSYNGTIKIINNSKDIERLKRIL